MRSGLLLLACLMGCTFSGTNATETRADEVGAETSGSDTGVGESTGVSESDTGASETGETGDENLFTSDQFLNIAHRGGGRLRPEATLPAFENALLVGADVIEMDLHATADGVIVVLHDDTVDRTTEGSGAVSAMSFADLRMLDAGYEFTTDGGQTFPYRGMGIVVPTLDEVLTSFPGRYYSMEIKQTEPPIVDAVLAILADHDVGNHGVLVSFDDPTIEAVRAANPNQFTAMSLAEMTEFVSQLANPDYQPPCQFLQSPWDLSSQAVIDRAHALGMKVHPWTVNSEPTMVDLIVRGIDGLMSDDPALLDQVAGE